MQTLFAEQPLIVSFMLGVLAVGLIYGWMQTGRKDLAYVGVVFALLIPVAWVIANHWITDRERIEMLIYETADAIKKNDHERALRLIADPATREQARRELGNFVFDEARIAKIREIELIEGTFPQEADVDLNVKVVVSQRAGGMQAVPVPRRLILRLQREGDTWVIIEYQHMPMVGGPDSYTTQRNP